MRWWLLKCALAERSREAAEEITKLAGFGVTFTKKTGELLTQLIPEIQHTAELVQEISAASTEQSAGTAQINRAIQQLDQITQQNTASSEEMAVTAEELASQAEQLQHTIAFFKIDEADWERNNLAKFEDPGQNVRKQDVEIDNEKGEGKFAGYSINREQDREARDEQDDKFERY